MDQIKIGKFIAHLRKEKGYTQEELATKLNISNKSVSRWENGKTMPDLSLIPPLCEILEISINELLSGEKIEYGDYQKKLEENIIINIDLLKKKIKQISKRLMIIVLCSIALIISIILGFIIYKELTYIKVPLNDNNILINACEDKTRIGLTISTKDNTPFLYDLNYDEDMNVYTIESIFKYIDEDNLKDIAPTTTILFDNEVLKIVYKNKIIYKKGDKLENCY